MAVRKQSAYLRVYEELKERILCGTYPIGSLLPPEPQLEKIFFVSRTTVRRAVELLSADGLIHVRQGHGTQVIAHKISQNLSNISSLSQTLEKKGFTVGTRSIYIRSIPAPPPVSEVLGLARDTAVAEINRIQTADGLPVALAKNYIPYELVRGIENETDKIVSLYQYLTKHYGIVMDAVSDTVSACTAGFEEAELLQIRPGDALLTLQRVCLRDNIPIEMDDIKIVASKYSFEIRSR